MFLASACHACVTIPQLSFFIIVARGSGLYNDPITSIECVAFIDRWLVNNELEKVGKQASHGLNVRVRSPLWRDVPYNREGKRLSITTQCLQLYDFLYYRFGLVAATDNVNERRLMSNTGRVCKVVCVYIIVFLQLEQWGCQNLSDGIAAAIMWLR